MFNAQAIAFVLVLPYAVTNLDGSTFAWDSFLAILALGVTSGAIALIAMSTLGSRVGAPRANIAIYFIPIVAIVLGVVVRDDTVETIALGGIALVLVGAFVATRADDGRQQPPARLATETERTP
jgi:drug/metabolite transporter (DMT)-like permease